MFGVGISSEDDRVIMAAVRSITDELTFVGTHEVDTGYWVYPKVGSRRASENEAQQNRLKRNYGQLMNPSPHFVEQELLRLFRAEADSVELKKANPSEPCKIDLMSAADLRILKKDLKQRIHEWEGSYRREMGREAGPQDKLPLRRVYEAYKETKGRLTQLDGGAAPAPTTSTTATQPPPPSQQPRTAAAGAPPIASRPHNPPPPPGGTAPPTSIRARTTGSEPVSANPSLNVSRGSSNQSRGSSSLPATSSQPTPAAVPIAPRASATAPPASSSRPASGTSSRDGAVPTGNISGFTPLSQLSDEDLKTEKRKLKRELHSFENSFRERHGREPRKEDREEVVKQYQRYAQLKAALSEP